MNESIRTTLSSVASDAIANQHKALQQRAALTSALSTFLDQASVELAEQVLQERTSIRARQRAGEALADEFGRRSSARRVIETWRDATVRREQRRVQEAKRRKQENEMGLSMRRVTLGDGDWSSDGGEEDEPMDFSFGLERDYRSTDSAVAKVRASDPPVLRCHLV